MVLSKCAVFRANPSKNNFWPKSAFSGREAKIQLHPILPMIRGLVPHGKGMLWLDYEPPSPHCFGDIDPFISHANLLGLYANLWGWYAPVSPKWQGLEGSWLVVLDFQIGVITYCSFSLLPPTTLEKELRTAPTCHAYGRNRFALQVYESISPRIRRLAVWYCSMFMSL